MSDNENGGRNPFGEAPVVAAPGGGASAAAVVQREVAEVQGAMVIAQRFPRDERRSMDRILRNCTRLSLAEQAIYQYARGGTQISGPSIRLAEELARSWGNMASGVIELERREGYSECLAYAWDYETNYRDERRFRVRHWRDTKGGGYQVKDERDIYEIIANQGARRKRACILAVIPGDVTEAAVDQCDETMRTKVDVTPERIKKMLDAFKIYGVTREAIEERIQRRMDSITPALFVQLGRIYTSIHEGASGPADWFTMPEESKDAAESKTGAGVKERLRQRKQSAAKSDDQPELAPVAKPEKRPGPEQPLAAETPEELSPEDQARLRLTDLRADSDLPKDAAGAIDELLARKSAKLEELQDLVAKAERRLAKAKKADA